MIVISWSWVWIFIVKRVNYDYLYLSLNDDNVLYNHFCIDNLSRYLISIFSYHKRGDGVSQILSSYLEYIKEEILGPWYKVEYGSFSTENKNIKEQKILGSYERFEKMYVGVYSCILSESLAFCKTF